MNKDLTTLIFGLNKIEPLEEKIRKKSEDNLVKLGGGRRGCTTTEVYTMIQVYFGKLIQKTLEETVNDLISDGGMKTWGKLNIVKSKTKDSISKYVNDAGEWTGSEVGKKLAARLEAWGDSLEKVEEEHKPLVDVAKKLGMSKFQSWKSRFLESKQQEEEEEQQQQQDKEERKEQQDKDKDNDSNNSKEEDRESSDDLQVNY
eukprot:scaffold8472_cov80-Cylindrotheca_fusiformis.AAC.1